MNIATYYKERRWLASEGQKSLFQQRQEMGLPRHVAPWSTLIAAMGGHWKPGCEEAVIAMGKETYESGFEVCLYEEPDRCLTPFDAIGTMRNHAYQKALAEGWEYLLYVDNDVKPSPGVLVALLQRQVPVVTPLIRYADGKDYGLTMPKLQEGQGLALVSSFVLSFVLFNMRTFTPWAAGGFWENALGADEGYHFDKLYAGSGVRPFLDTDQLVECVEGPHFPLDAKQKGNLWTPKIVK